MSDLTMHNIALSCGLMQAGDRRPFVLQTVISDDE